MRVIITKSMSERRITGKVKKKQRSNEDKSERIRRNMKRTVAKYMVQRRNKVLWEANEQVQVRSFAAE